jgi:hypothetical protein
MTHTPGPWDTQFLFTESGYIYRVYANGTSRDAIADVQDAWDVETVAANARLLRAAPDLLEALEYALETLEREVWGAALVKQAARQAIKKATEGEL